MYLYLYLIYLPMMFWKMSTSFVFPGVEFNQRRNLYLYCVFCILYLIFLKMSTSSFVFPGVEFNQRRKQFCEGKVFQQKTSEQLTREFQMWTHINSKYKCKNTKNTKVQMQKSMNIKIQKNIQNYSTEVQNLNSK